MQANSSQTNFNCDRQNEYRKEKERLNTIPSAAAKGKPVPADLMIENLLRDTCLKASQMSQTSDSYKHFNFDLPSWLHCDSSLIPENYEFLWSLVQSSIDMADTEKVSQLLLTSGLHIDVLGFIWNLANKTIPGKLTKQEFFIVLALITLAQTGYAFNNLSVLKLVPAPIPSPVLQVNVLKKFLSHSYVNTLLENSNLNLTQCHSNRFQENIPLSSVDSLKVNLYTETHRPSSSSNNLLKTNMDTKNKPKSFNSSLPLPFCNNDIEKVKDVNTLKVNNEFSKNTKFTCIESSPTPELEDEFSDFQSVPAENTKDFKETFINPNDEFTEFQSGNIECVDPLETIVITQKKEIPKIPLPKSFIGKLPNLKSDILKISPESERKLKVLSQSESLSSLPESKISSTNKVSTSISVLGSNHDIGSRLANHSLNVKLDKPKLHKHHKIKINSNPPPNYSAGEGEIIFGVKTSNLEHIIPKCCPKKPSNGNTFLLKETKIINENSSVQETLDVLNDETNISSSHSVNNTRKIEIPMLGIFNETVLPTQTQSQISNIDFISVQEDKYSALREIEINVNQDSVTLKPHEENDEFGDFLSADISQPSLFANNFNQHTMVTSNLLINNVKLNEELSVENDDNEDWSDWNFSVKPKTETIPSVLNNSTTINNNSLILNDKLATLNKEVDDFDSFNLLGEEQIITFQVNTQDTFSSQSDILGNSDTKSILNIKTLFPNPENSKVTSEGLDTKSSDTSNFDLLSLESALPQSNNNQTEDEIWHFFSVHPKFETNDLIRHDSLPSLDFKMPVSEESEQEIIWRKCYESCRNIIQEASEIFARVHKKSVLDEIFANPKTSEYLNDLNIAYQIINRIKENSNDAIFNQEDLNKQWKRIKELCFEYNIKLKEEINFSSEEKHQCSICFGFIGEDLHNQNNHDYHLSCANLWINCVEETLPTPS